MTTKSSCRAVRAGKAGLPALLLLLLSSGCHSFFGAMAALQGGEAIAPQFELTQGPLLILIDDRRSLVDRPNAIREVHRSSDDLFKEYGVNHRVIPFSEWRRLQRSERHYDKLSVREIGEKLGAEQVLYIDITRFTLQAEPGAPLFKGEFVARVKVLSTERVGDNRLWPREQAGRLRAVRTEPVSMDGDTSASDVATQLGDRLGRSIAELFFEHREYYNK